jgi:hypothetical protein
MGFSLINCIVGYHSTRKSVTSVTLATGPSIPLPILSSNLWPEKTARSARFIIGSHNKQHQNKIVSCTANEGPYRIQYKCLFPIYVFPEIKLCSELFPKQNYNVLPPYSYIHVCICERFNYSQDRSDYFAAAQFVDKSWEYSVYVNRSRTHECRNWD